MAFAKLTINPFLGQKLPKRSQNELMERPTGLNVIPVFTQFPVLTTAC